MTVPPSAPKPEAALQKESRIFAQQIMRLFNCLINSIYDLSAKGSRRRRLALTTAFLALGFIISLRAHPLSDWMEEFSHLLQYLFNPIYAQTAPNTPSIFIAFVLGTFFSPQTLQYLPVVVLPFLIALQAAATYLADIFELKQVRIAREFILQVALTGSSQHIRISGGDIAEEHRNSPIYLIGGPGKVLVELDSAALFEKPNGQPHIIGPTVDGKVTLEGFERYREARDLRDQYTPPLDVKSRSLEGLPISATDVRLVFSVWRKNKPPTAKTPHPFDEEAVKTLVYSLPSKVTNEGPNPSELPASWTIAAQELIRNELNGFMNRHRLTEYLASIGFPETERAKRMEDQIAAIGKAVVSEDDTVEPRNVPPPPPFKSRHVISNLFNQFTEDFTRQASQRGVELHWVGIGTWKTPNEIVPAKHLEAWRISRENFHRSSDQAMNGFWKEAHLQHTLRLLQEIPLARFHESSNKDHKDAVIHLLTGYYEQLIENIELQRKTRRHIHPDLFEALKLIENILGREHWHWVGGASPSSAAGAGVGNAPPPPRPRSPRSKAGSAPGVPSTPPISPEEEDLFNDLLNKTHHDTEQVERLIDYERKGAPHADRKELIRRAIERWIRDN